MVGSQALHQYGLSGTHADLYKKKNIYYEKPLTVCLETLVSVYGVNNWPKTYSLVFQFSNAEAVIS